MRAHLVPISSCRSLRNWNHFVVRAYLVPISSSGSAFNWNHFDMRGHLVPIFPSGSIFNWNHFVVRAHLVPIFPSGSIFNWNHFVVRAYFAPIRIFCMSAPGAPALSPGPHIARAAAAERRDRLADPVSSEESERECPGYVIFKPAREKRCAFVLLQL